MTGAKRMQGARDSGGETSPVLRSCQSAETGRVHLRVRGNIDYRCVPSGDLGRRRRRGLYFEKRGELSDWEEGGTVYKSQDGVI